VIWGRRDQMFVYIGGAIAATVRAQWQRADGGWDSITRAAAERGSSACSTWSAASRGSGSLRIPAPCRAPRGALLSMASHGTDQLDRCSVFWLPARLSRGGSALIGSRRDHRAEFSLFLLVGLLLYGHYGGRSVLRARAQAVRRDLSDVHHRRPAAGTLRVSSSPTPRGGAVDLAGSMSSMASSSVLDPLPLVPSDSG